MNNWFGVYVAFQHTDLRHILIEWTRRGSFEIHPFFAATFSLITYVSKCARAYNLRMASVQFGMVRPESNRRVLRDQTPKWSTPIIRCVSAEFSANHNGKVVYFRLRAECGDRFAKRGVNRQTIKCQVSPLHSSSKLSGHNKWNKAQSTFPTSIFGRMKLDDKKTHNKLLRTDFSECRQNTLALLRLFSGELFMRCRSTYISPPFFDQSL